MTGPGFSQLRGVAVTVSAPQANEAKLEAVRNDVFITNLWAQNMDEFGRSCRLARAACIF